MTDLPRRRRRPPQPLDGGRLEELALAYVARFATSRARLRRYLERKVAERGWAPDGEPGIDRLVAKLSAAGYVDDAAFALSRARDLAGRGYGERRLGGTLHQAGIGDADGEAARAHAAAERVAAALAFARRRRLGPYASEVPDPKLRERQLAALIRAGHPFELARRILALEPGTEPDIEALE